MPDGCWRRGPCPTGQSGGVEVGFETYSLRIASHAVDVPRENIGGNLFITLPDKQRTKLIKG